MDATRRFGCSARPSARLRRLLVLAILGVGGAGCEPPIGYEDPHVPGVAVVNAPEIQEKEVREENLVVASGIARAKGLTARDEAQAFGADQDGTKLLVDFLGRARDRGARYVSDISIYFATTREEKPVECKIGVYPEDAVVPVEVPAHTALVPAQVPVTRMVTEQEYRCRFVPKQVTRSETQYEQRCHMVSKPVTSYETTYTTQYDYASKSTRSVPQTRSVTHYESQNECRSEPVMRQVMRTEMQNECSFEPVTHSVTRYEFQLQMHFVPARLDYVQQKKLAQSDPVCYALPEGEPPKGNRIEAKIYLSRS
jgi:hypothetical protein